MSPREPGQFITSMLSRVETGIVSIPSTRGEWSETLDQAEREGLGGLLLEAIDTRNIETPEYANRRLQLNALSVASCNAQLLADLEPLVRSLNEADIPVMLLKGAALNLTTYPTLGMRPMSDVDLLVRERDALRACEVLRRAGCRDGIALMRHDFFPRFYYETEFVFDGNGALRIDLHARPFRPLRYARLIEEKEFWREVNAVKFGCASALVPSAEVMLIHLAAHAAFHGCSRLIWLYDMMRWVDTHGRGVDWVRFFRLCEAWRLSLPVREAITLAEARLEQFLPSASRKQLSTQTSEWRDRLTLRQAPRDAGSPWLHVLTDLLCTPGVGFRLGYLLAYLNPGRDHLGAVYPYRHVGWTLAASVYRAGRAGMRMASGLLRTCLKSQENRSLGVPLAACPPVFSRIRHGSQATSGTPRDRENYALTNKRHSFAPD